MSTTIDINKLKSEAEKAGQSHLFEYWDDLNSDEQSNLLNEIAEIDFNEISTLVDSLKTDSENNDSENTPEPPSFIPTIDNGGDKKDWNQAVETGIDALKAGRVAAFTVAGGQGTRLGYDGPKGTFPVSPVSKHPLFKVFADKILFANDEYGCEIPWYIMVSEINRDATIDFFKEHKYFDLNPEKIKFITQGSMPAVDYDGKIILETKGRIARSPDGHGGALRAMLRSGAIEEMKNNGNDIISYFQVDNPLVHCMDPAFIGFHILNNSKLSSKTLPKAFKEEKVGHFCLINNKLKVIEYSDMPQELLDAEDENGLPKFNLGSIAIHVFDRDFVSQMTDPTSDVSMPFHKAKKKIKFLNSNGQTETPSDPNGIKFEMFIFDALPFAEKTILVETKREDDFSPVKNAEGVDSVQTCNDHQLQQFARWLQAAGVKIELNDAGVPITNIEISQRFASSQESFIKKWNSLAKKPDIADGLVIQ